ncbi:MAG: hypothetical protein K6F59_02140 [Gammaproteobacteria bacterium]|nr:hypothetical protein [Gammaproteobacteria bacterium]
MKKNLTQEEILLNKQTSLEKMKYKRDNMSFIFALLGLVFNVLYFFALYKNNGNFYYSWKMGISVLYNLLFMLFTFYSAQEVKGYHRNFGILLFLLGVGQIVRMFVYPKQALAAEALEPKAYTLLIIYLSISAAFLIAGGIVSVIKSTILKNYVKKESQKEVV